MFYEAIIPISLFCCTTIMVIFLRRFIHTERMAMIERGITDFKTPAIRSYRFSQRDNTFNTLRWGLLAIGAGIGLFVGGIMAKIGFDDDGISFGLVLFFGGLGLFLAYFLHYGMSKDKKNLDLEDDTTV